MPSVNSNFGDVPVFAVFDFDNTLIKTDSLLPFLIFCYGKKKVYLGLLKLFPSFVTFVLKLKSRQSIKEDILTYFFYHISRHDLQNLADLFSSTALEKYVKKEALERLRWHQNQGHRCILVSASIDVYLIPWGKKNGFDRILGSKLATDHEDRVTGKLLGVNCWGKEKKQRLLEILPKENYVLYAYGDSAGDQELLAMADYPFYRTFQ